MKLLPRWLRENFKVKAGMFILAVLLWFLVVSEKSYDYIVTTPIINIGLSTDRALVKPIPTEVKVKYRGRGRELLRLIYVNKPHLNLDLTHPPSSGVVKLKPEMVVIPGGLLVSILEIVEPDSIPIRLDDFRQISVPVIPTFELTFEPGYVMVGAPTIEPSQITLTGPEKALKGIKSVRTTPLVRTDLKQTFETPLDVNLPNGFGIESTSRSVFVKIRVERLGERALDGLPLTIRSAPIGKRLEIEPNAVKVQLNGPVSTIADLRLENLTAWIDWDENNPSKPGWLPVHVESEPGVEVKTITPSSVRAVLRKQ